MHLAKIKRAVISVSDKTGIVEFAKKLETAGVELISTGGTYKLLKENDIAVKEVSDVTGFPEMLDGRVKTLHPKIHAGILARRDIPDHMSAIKCKNFYHIDMVVINLYPFKQTVLKEGVSFEDIVENIDIGGPSMIRAAAKNYQSVAVVTKPEQYQEIIDQMYANAGDLSPDLHQRLMAEAFDVTSQYDAMIAS
ncbi:MAG: bifunctional phosphoribosylaminoimidazolecarboxamide formyltransferase/IMP cyclohydrolase, partial [Candidatus Methanomethylophilaceae archaeon]|nr:bifunctional phosphoribosylaminoimidazolecarboxamide formyltransferase/IMP cyclohydrolase [Candidatus Methanomethylophilaceae archaeon]